MSRPENASLTENFIFCAAYFFYMMIYYIWLFSVYIFNACFYLLVFYLFLSIKIEKKVNKIRKVKAMKDGKRLVQCKFVLIHKVANCEVFCNIVLQYISKSSISLGETDKFHRFVGNHWKSLSFRKD